MGVFKKLRVILNNNLERSLRNIYTEFNNRTSNGKTSNNFIEGDIFQTYLIKFVFDLYYNRQYII